MIDTHAHLNLEDFDQDRLKVISSCQEAGIKVINAGIDYQSSVRAISLAQEKGFYASVGVHPNSPSEDPDKLSDLIDQPGVVAIGETGLDFYRRPDDATEKHRQRELFLSQGQLARRAGLPLIIHCRRAYPELMPLLRRELKGVSGVIHSFSGSLIEARELLHLGYYLGFNGLVFRQDLDEVIISTPLERILIETDSPFLSPPSINQSRNVPYLGLRPVVEKIAFIKKVSTAEIIDLADKNAYHLFQLDKHE